MYITPLGTEISQNHLSILKWSLNKCWSWKIWTLSFQMPCRTHFSDTWMQRSIISNEKVSYLYFGILPENRWMSFLHSTSHYSLRKSLKDLSDHLNFFVSCQGRSQLSPAIFRASRNHLVASKQSYMLKLSKSAVSQGSVKANLTHDLIYMRPKVRLALTKPDMRGKIVCFFIYKRFWSDQTVSGSSKNSWR